MIIRQTIKQDIKLHTSWILTDLHTSTEQFTPKYNITQFATYAQTLCTNNATSILLKVVSTRA